ncbi:hypothetical protein Tco_1121331 [Tanacetum coccineum]|uniref:DUF4219 domain-containing protein/UBN2 domain-containing protein n=1 Tax=Tanacetum coccineum TaxID=301880 RepID=A0ABQ5IXD8_9ASTR
MYYHILIPRLSLDYGLHLLNVDADVLEMTKYVKENKIILVYVEHESINVDSSIFVTPKNGVAIAVDNHLRNAPIESDSSPDVNRNLTPMLYLAYYLNGDFPPVSRNKETQVLKVVSFEEQTDELKKKLAKNNEAKMVLYNVLPKKEYERIFMCRTAKDIWQSLFITHQDNSKVKDNKIDLLVQQYKQFTIFEEESIDSDFARFNTIITSLKALDEGFYSKNYVRKFLRALHPKWRAKVTMIEGSKDLSSLALDELIDNLKVHEVVMEKDSKIYKGKKKRAKSIALKAKK